MNIKVAILDVGQGDTIVVHTTDLTPNAAIVIDCVDAIRTIKYFRDNGISDVSAVFITHLHTDHYRQACSLLEEFPNALLVYRCILDNRGIKALLRPEPAHEAAYERLERWALVNINRVRTAGAPINHLDTTIWGKSIEILHPHEPNFARLVAGDFNDTSLIIKITGKQSSILLCGDVQERGFRACKDIVGTSLNADFVKMPHHGAWNNPPGTSVAIDEMLDAVNPYEAFISVGTLNTYRHPNIHVLDSLKNRDIATRCTQATQHCLDTPSAVPISCAGDIVIDLSEPRASALSHTWKTSHTDNINRFCGINKACCTSTARFH
jgi:competence protein ComEC